LCRFSPVRSVPKAAEDCRSPKAGAGSDSIRMRAASWSAAVLCRFSTVRSVPKAPEGWRSPKAVAGSGSSRMRAASWSAAVLCRFWICRELLKSLLLRCILDAQEDQVMLVASDGQAAGVELHRPAAEVREIMLHLEIGEDGILRQDFLQQRA